MPQGGEVLQDFVHQQYDSDGNELCARLTNPKTQRCVGSEALHTLQWVPFLWGGCQGDLLGDPVQDSAEVVQMTFLYPLKEIERGDPM